MPSSSELWCRCVTALRSLCSVSVCWGGVRKQWAGEKVEPKSCRSQGGTEIKQSMLSSLICGDGGQNVCHCCVPVFASWPGITWTEPLWPAKAWMCLSVKVADGWLCGQGGQDGWVMEAFYFAVVFLVTGIYFKVTLSPSGSFCVASETCWPASV